MPLNTLVPIDITAPVDDASDGEDGLRPLSIRKSNSPTPDASKSVPGPAIQGRVSDRLKMQMRSSRSASLVIPVVDTSMGAKSDDEGNDENNIDIVDITTNLYTPRDEVDETEMGTENKQGEHPQLPVRPPQTPPRRLDSKADASFEPLSTFGMDRVRSSQFSPATSKNDGMDRIDFEAAPLKKDTFESKYADFLSQTRKYQIDYTITLLKSANLTVDDSVFFEKIHSSDLFISTLSSMRDGDYTNTNRPILYTLILKSLKINESVFDEKVEFDDSIYVPLIDSLSFLIKSPANKVTELKTDIALVYSFFDSINEVRARDGETDTSVIPNPLVTAFLYRSSSKYVLGQTLVLAVVLNEYVLSTSDSSAQFRFMLLRSIESIDPKLLLQKNGEFNNPLSYVSSLIDSRDFWVKFVKILYENEQADAKHTFGLNIVLFNVITNGVYSLIDVIINLRHHLGIFGVGEGNTSESTNIIPDLMRFSREFTILNESGESQFTNITLDKLYSRNQELRTVLQEKKKMYNELLFNYQQLNEEKMSVEDLITKHTEQNKKLQFELKTVSEQVDQMLSQYDVIQETVRKNERVQQMNETMMIEIERLKLENMKLKSK